MEIFEKTIRLPVAAELAFAWHEQPGALARLNPPWEKVEEVRRSGGIRNGARVTIRATVAGFATEWEIEHRDYIVGKQFRDVLLRGPFAHWEHLHHFTPVSKKECILTDRVTYKLLGGVAGNLLAGKFTRKKLERLFRYRHRVTADDLLTWRIPGNPRQRILIAGGSGLIGRALIPLLETRGYDIVRLVRKMPRQPGECFWDPSKSELDRSAAGEIDAVINLSGENVGAGRWTKSRRAKILQSRVDATKTLLAFVRDAQRRPRVWINASATGFYGSRGDEMLDESSPRGRGFLSDVCRDWENMAEGARGLGVRTIITRFGVVLSPRGGILAKVLPIFRLGLGGKMGDGKAWLSWIAIDDVAGIIAHALREEKCEGVLDTVAPHPVTGGRFAAELGAVLGRPAIFRVPKFALRAAFGEMADEMIFASARVSARRVVESGYAFRFTELFVALGHLLGMEQEGR